MVSNSFQDSLAHNSFVVGQEILVGTGHFMTSPRTVESKSAIVGVGPTTFESNVTVYLISIDLKLCPYLLM